MNDEINITPVESVYHEIKKGDVSLGKINKILDSWVFCPNVLRVSFSYEDLDRILMFINGLKTYDEQSRMGKYDICKD